MMLKSNHCYFLTSL